MRKLKISIFIMIMLISIMTLTACKKENQTDYDYLVLVNKYSRLPEDWEGKVKLVSTKNAWDEDIKVEKEAYEQYLLLKEDVEKDLEKYHTTIELDSTYRSVKAQQELWDEWSKDPEKGIDYVKKFVAVPGYSEHHTGLAIDICLKKEGELIFDNDEMIAEREIFSIIHSKLSKYGFILRYLENRDSITGYAYEPWHLRYVGSKEIAKEIMDNDITLEEYLAKEEDLINHKEAAKYQIEKTLQSEFEKNIYQDNLENARFDVKHIYTYKDGKTNKEIKLLKLGKKDLAFEVEYQIQPKEGVDIQPLMVVDGEYDEQLGWIVGINRLGILKYNSETLSYELNNFGTGW